MRPTAAEMAAQLGLEPHPEGGWFRETYRSDEAVRTARGTRAASTAILFLVTMASPSRFHRLQSDELWVYQGGLPLELVTLDADGEAHARVLGDAASRRGALPQALVPAGAWQAARVAPRRTETAGVANQATDGADQTAGRTAAEMPAGAGDDDRSWSLVSCLVTPGFDYDDLELARRDELVRLCPAETELIVALT
jgi:predicted cupin superfamily sugar epimerase